MARFFPRNATEFEAWSPSEESCVQYLARRRWPKGFVCPSCLAVDPRPAFVRTRLLWQCRACSHQASVTTGTLLHRTRLPLSSCLRGAYLLGTVTPFKWRSSRPRSIRTFQKATRIRSYSAAWRLYWLLYGAVDALAKRDGFGYMSARPKILSEVVLCLVTSQPRFVSGRVRNSVRAG